MCPLQSKGKITVFLLQEVLFALVVHSVCERLWTAQARENSRATNNAFFIFGRSSGHEYVAMVTSCIDLAAHQTLQTFNPVDLHRYSIFCDFTSLCVHIVMLQVL